MSLPDLALQIVYGRLAWGLVAAAMLLAALPTMLPRLLPTVSPALTRRSQATIVAAVLALMLLPGAASPAYWLILVFQYPSGILLGCSLVSLYARWQDQPVSFALPSGLALPLAVAGLVLYLDAFGVLALGWYYDGFSAVAAPLLACAAAAVCVAAIVLGRTTGTVAALLVGTLLFSLLRLPTGNLWDALLDPLVWAWALGSVVVAAARMAAARKAGPLQPQTEPAPVPDLDLDVDPELVPAHGIEQQL
jgi:hypothetical protein